MIASRRWEAWRQQRRAGACSACTIAPASLSTGWALVSTVVPSDSVGGLASIAAPSWECSSAAKVVAPSASSGLIVGATGASAPVVAASPLTNSDRCVLGAASSDSRLSSGPISRRVPAIVVVELVPAAGHRVAELLDRGAQTCLGLGPERRERRVEVDERDVVVLGRVRRERERSAVGHPAGPELARDDLDVLAAQDRGQPHLVLGVRRQRLEAPLQREAELGVGMRIAGGRRLGGDRQHLARPARRRSARRRS